MAAGEHTPTHAHPHTHTHAPTHTHTHTRTHMPNCPTALSPSTCVFSSMYPPHLAPLLTFRGLYGLIQQSCLPLSCVICSSWPPTQACSAGSQPMTYSTWLCVERSRLQRCFQMSDPQAPPLCMLGSAWMSCPPSESSGNSIISGPLHRQASLLGKLFRGPFSWLLC